MIITFLLDLNPHGLTPPTPYSNRRNSFLLLEKEVHSINLYALLKYFLIVIKWRNQIISGSQ